MIADKPTRIILVRHGQTELNLAGKLSGQTETALTELGQKQAQGVAKMLAEKKIDKIYASPYSRAVDTAKPLADSCGMEIETLPGLMEQNFGEWEGRNFNEVFSIIPGGPEGLMRGPYLGRFPAGEGTEKFAGRVMACLHDEILAPNDGKTVAVFTHAGVIAVMMCHFLGIDPFANFFRIASANGSVSIVDRFALHLFRIICINRLPEIGE